MTALRIDRDKLAKDDPLPLRDLHGFCSLCQSKGRYARALAYELNDLAWQD